MANLGGGGRGSIQLLQLSKFDLNHAFQHCEAYSRRHGVMNDIDVLIMYIVSNGIEVVILIKF